MDKDKLRTLLNHARKYCPYFTFLPPLDKEKSIIEYLHKIPLLSRQIVQSQQARLLSSTGDTNGWRKIQTTGRTGEPVKVILSQESQATDAVLLSMHVDNLLGAQDWREGRIYHLTLHAGSASRTIRALWHDQGQITKWNLIRLWRESDQRFLDAIEVIQDCVVTMMPSVAELLCSRLQRSEATKVPHPLLVILSGEMVSSKLKSLVTETLHCPVTSLYTMAEVGIVASEHPGESTYQVEEKSTIVEILNENSEQMSDGQEGDIVVTPLNNYAMPLIRYRTGDRGYWIDSNSSPPVFRIVDARQPKFLTTSDGKSINTIRFAKILASLGLGYYNIDQNSEGNIIFSYSANGQNLDEDSLVFVKTVIRSALGPDIVIEIRKVTNRKIPEIGPEAIATNKNQLDHEPLGPDINTLAEWLHQRLRNVSGIETAILTGSSLDPASTTRFSDIDMIIMVEHHPDDPNWIDLGRELKFYIPKLSINFDILKGFSKRAPLLTLRFLSEQISLFGTLDESVLPRPSAESLCLNGLFWAQETIATISHRDTDVTKKTDGGPMFEAWLTAKWIVNALRYKYATSGEKNMAIKAILDRLQTDQDIPYHWKSEFLRVVNISREIVPPPLFDRDEFERYSKLAISFIRLTQDYLMQTYDNLKPA
jgi:phenylacetate-coenzyme A ligase PaaK-like adenylate-forming protein